MTGATLAAWAGLGLRGDEAEALPILAASGAATGADERSYPLPTADGVTIDRDAQVVLVRFQGHVYAFNLACPHESAGLRWKEENARFQCPRHGSLYQPDGTYISGRATRSMDRFAVRRVGDRLVVELSHLFRSDQQPQDWAGATLIP
jgi:Rieske Fe-S protein